MKTKKLIVWIVLCCLILPICSYTMNFAHEEAHKQICEGFGGRVTAEHISVFGQSYMRCSIVETPEYRFAQANVDAFGYQHQAFMYALLMTMMLVGTFVVVTSD